MVEGELYVERRKHKRIEKSFKVNYKVIMAEEEVQEIKKNIQRSMTILRLQGQITGLKTYLCFQVLSLAG